jgi:predicted transcriptional regulator
MEDGGIACYRKGNPMELTTAPRALTVRIQPELYEAATVLARRRRQSLNGLVQDSLAAAIRAADDEELYVAFERFGVAADASIGYAHSAQAEVALANEYGDEHRT